MGLLIVNLMSKKGLIRIVLKREKERRLKYFLSLSVDSSQVNWR